MPLWIDIRCWIDLDVAMREELLIRINEYVKIETLYMIIYVYSFFL